LDANIDANALSITFDYGEGCKPALYVKPTLAGSVTGLSFVTLNAFDLDFTNATFDGIALEGNMAGGFSRVGETTTLAMSVNLRADGGFAVSGSVTIEMDDATGDYAFTDAELNFESADLGPWTATYSNPTVSFAQTGSFAANAGSAVAQSVTGSQDDNPQIVEVDLAD
jgi:hypothetical protein